MSKVWQVAWFEYQRNVFKKSFIMVLLSVPLMIAVNVGIGFFLEGLKKNDQPVGYIDQSGVFDRDVPSPASPSSKDYITFIRFDDAGEADAALEAGEIQAYYLLPEDYLESRGVLLVYKDKPGENAERQFFDFLQINLVSHLDEEIAYRVATGSDITVQSMDGRRVVPGGGPSFGVLMPMLISLAFLALLLMSSGYLMSAVADEKENRTMEILVTTISPGKLISGKVLGISAIAFTLFLTWSIVTVAGIFIAKQMGIAWFQNTTLDWQSILGVAMVMVPSYILSAALMAGIGAMSTTTQEGQSISAVFIILHLIPLYISMLFLKNPHNTVAVVLSILPFTSLMTIGMRNLFTIVPFWQIAASTAVQTVCAVGGLWLASRAFRLGMLRYGQRLSFRSLFTRISDTVEVQP